VKFVHLSANDDTPSPLTKCPQCGKVNIIKTLFAIGSNTTVFNLFISSQMVKWIKEHLKVVHENEKLVHKCLECNKVYDPFNFTSCPTNVYFFHSRDFSHGVHLFCTCECTQEKGPFSVNTAYRYRFILLRLTVHVLILV